MAETESSKRIECTESKPLSRTGIPLSLQMKQTIVNIKNYFRKRNPDWSVRKIVSEISEAIKLSKSSVKRVLYEEKNMKTVLPPKTKKRVKQNGFHIGLYDRQLVISMVKELTTRFKRVTIKQIWQWMRDNTTDRYVSELDFKNCSYYTFLRIFTKMGLYLGRINDKNVLMLRNVVKICDKRSKHMDTNTTASVSEVESYSQTISSVVETNPSPSESEPVPSPPRIGRPCIKELSLPEPLCSSPLLLSGIKTYSKADKKCKSSSETKSTPNHSRLIVLNSSMSPNLLTSNRIIAITPKPNQTNVCPTISSNSNLSTKKFIVKRIQPKDIKNPKSDNNDSSSNAVIIGVVNPYSNAIPIKIKDT